MAIRQAQEAVKQAIADGHAIIEVDFPVTSLNGVNGDGEGQNEMNANLKMMRQFLNAWRSESEGVRIFFPDNKEAQIAKSGLSMDPNAGRSAMEATFSDTRYKMSYLTKQNVAFSLATALFGSEVRLDQWSPADFVKDTDRLIVIAYPSFNPKEELAATLEIYNRKAKDLQIPIVIFNGELDRVRGGYYSTFLNPTFARIEKELMPIVFPAYYLHNFKGSRPGSLFRSYPGPFEVYRRNILKELGSPGAHVGPIWSGEIMPSLKQVSLEILPSRDQ